MSDTGFVEQQGDITRRHVYDESTGRMYEQVLQDISAYLAECKALREQRPQHGPKYKRTFTMVSSIPIGFGLAMLNGQCCSHYGKRRTGVSYNIWAADKDEYKRALLHIQSHHQDLLTMTGKPIDRKSRSRRPVTK